MKIGLEALSVHVPRYVLSAETLAEANRVDSAKYTKGIGVKGISLCAVDEDPVTMAADAAKTLLERWDVDKERIGMCLVGTESGVDASKPVAVYVHGLLGLPATCRTLDTQHACYSATAALKLARDWCAGAGRGKKALVIATDIARYDIASPGEPTQGAGAVAMLVSDEPSLFTFDDAPEAFYSKDVMDFWRPTYRQTALVQGKLSIDSYLEVVDHTYEQYQQHSGFQAMDYRYLLFHVPFPKMAKKAFWRVAAIDNGGEQADEAVTLADYETRTQPALYANTMMGNLYSGSLYLSLAGLLSYHREQASSQRLGLFSYGSGCCGEFFSGVTAALPKDLTWRIGLEEGLARREAVSYESYRALRAAQEQMAHDGSFSDLQPRHASDTVGHRFLGIADHQRLYAAPAPKAMRLSPPPTNRSVSKIAAA